MWMYYRTEDGNYQVAFDGHHKMYPDLKFETRAAATARVSYLNGGSSKSGHLTDIGAIEEPGNE